MPDIDFDDDEFNIDLPESFNIEFGGQLNPQKKDEN